MALDEDGNEVNQDIGLRNDEGINNTFDSAGVGNRDESNDRSPGKVDAEGNEITLH